MEFRFPHPFENVVDAIKAAADPGNPEDGGLAVQLLNENNHAIEDRLSAPVDNGYAPVLITKTSAMGLAGTSDSDTVDFTIPSEGVWLINPFISPDGISGKVTAAGGGQTSLTMKFSTDGGFLSSVTRPLVIPYSLTPVSLALSPILGVFAGSFIYDTAWWSGGATLPDRLAAHITVSCAGTGTWTNGSGGDAPLAMRMYGVRLGDSYGAPIAV